MLWIGGAERKPDRPTGCCNFHELKKLLFDASWVHNNSYIRMLKQVETIQMLNFHVLTDLTTSCQLSAVEKTADVQASGSL